jgi:acyl dehydratase
VISHEHIGRTSPAITLDVEKGHIRRFAEAIGDPNPIYRDEAAARAAGHSRIPAPPTFATALRPNDAREGLGIDWSKILHGEQEYELLRPLHAGDRVTLVQTLSDIFEKSGKSGTMQFLVLDTVARDAATGEPVFRARATIVVKS